MTLLTFIDAVDMSIKVLSVIKVLINNVDKDYF